MMQANEKLENNNNERKKNRKLVTTLIITVIVVDLRFSMRFDEVIILLGCYAVSNGS